jgi:hypothetical protein
MIDKIHQERFSEQINKDIEKCLSNNLFDSQPISKENPHKWDNDYGRFEWNGGEDVYFQPKKGIEYINVKIKIQKQDTEDLDTEDKELVVELKRLRREGFVSGLKDAEKALEHLLEKKMASTKENNPNDNYLNLRPELQYITRRELKTFMEAYISGYEKDWNLK